MGDNEEDQEDEYNEEEVDDEEPTKASQSDVRDDVKEQEPPSQDIMGDMLDLGMGGVSGVNEPTIKLKQNPQCTSKAFQKLWKGTKDNVEKFERTLTSEDATLQFETLANNANFKTMASAPSGRKQ